MKKIIIIFSALIVSLNMWGQTMQTVNIGTTANDHTGDPVRTFCQKFNYNDSMALIKDATIAGEKTFSDTVHHNQSIKLGTDKGILLKTLGNPYTIHTASVVFNGFRDDAGYFGYNMKPGSPSEPIDTTQPMFRTAFESDYYYNNIHAMEWNMDYGHMSIPSSYRRPMAVYIDKATHDVSLGFKSGADSASLSLANGNVGINVLGNSSISLGINARSRNTGINLENGDIKTSGIISGMYPSVFSATNRLNISEGGSGAVFGCSSNTFGAGSINIESVYGLKLSGNTWIKGTSGTITDAITASFAESTIGTNNTALQVLGHMAIGTPNSLNSIMAINSTKSFAGYGFALNFYPTITSTNHAYGIYCNPSSVTTAADKWYTSISTNVGTYNCINGTYVGYYGASPNAGTGTLDNMYMIYLEPAGRGTNRWGIYQTGTTNNYFGGSVSIGTTSIDSALTVNGGINTRSIKATGYIHNIQPHFFSTFQDSSMLMDMTEDTPKQITNTNKTLWPHTEMIGFTESGDTVINTYAGGYDYKFEYNAVGGGAAADYRYYLKKKSGTTTTTVYKYLTSNAGGTVERTLNTHVHLLAGDKLWMEVENTTNSGDITVYAGIIRVEAIHLD